MKPNKKIKRVFWLSDFGNLIDVFTDEIVRHICVKGSFTKETIRPIVAKFGCEMLYAVGIRKDKK